jgi:hypothetical protein
MSEGLGQRREVEPAELHAFWRSDELVEDAGHGAGEGSSVPLQGERLVRPSSHPGVDRLGAGRSEPRGQQRGVKSKDAGGGLLDQRSERRITVQGRGHLAGVARRESDRARGQLLRQVPSGGLEGGKPRCLEAQRVESAGRGGKLHGVGVERLEPLDEPRRLQRPHVDVGPPVDVGVAHERSHHLTDRQGALGQREASVGERGPGPARLRRRELRRPWRDPRPGCAEPLVSRLHHRPLVSIRRRRRTGMRLLQKQRPSLRGHRRTSARMIRASNAANDIGAFRLRRVRRTTERAAVPSNRPPAFSSAP